MVNFIEDVGATVGGTAADAASSMNLLLSLGNIFAQLFGEFIKTGDFSYLLNAVFVIAPVIGFFLAIYGLIYFLGVITIFKDQEHHRFARMFAIGVSLAALTVGSTFRLFLSWIAGSLITFVIIIIVIFIIIILVKRLTASSYAASADKQKAAANYYASAKDGKSAYADMQKEFSEFKREDKLLRREDKNMKNVSNNISGSFLREGAYKGELNVLERLEQLSHDLGKLNSLSDDGAAGKNKNQLMKELSGIAGGLSVDYQKHKDIDNILEATKNLEVKELQFEADETKINKMLENHLRDLLKKEGHGRKHQRAKSFIKEDNEMKQYIDLLLEQSKKKKDVFDKLKDLNDQAGKDAKDAYTPLQSVMTAFKQNDVHQAQTAVQNAIGKIKQLIQLDKQIEDLIHLWKNIESKEEHELKNGLENHGQRLLSQLRAEQNSNSSP